MTFWMLMAGLFVLIYVKKPLAFRNVLHDYIFLITYLTVWTLYVVNTSFYHVISQDLLFIITTMMVSPLFIAFFQQTMTEGQCH
ncbi:hypothetical protein [Paraliobacillus ryukyuensis]|nr:hypothetical protein [Paraliobacillus ryukyuensis]